MVRWALLAVMIGAALGDVGCGEPTSTQKACKSIHCSRMVTSEQGIGYCVRGLPLDVACSENSDCHQFSCRNKQSTPCKGTTDCVCSLPATDYKDKKSGTLAALGAALTFGCMFVPLHRRVDPASVDVATQFLLCAGAWLTGIAFALARPGTTIHPLAVLGGGLFSFANILSPLIIKLIGPGAGMAVWSSASLLSGWTVSYFGLFGLKEAGDMLEKVPTGAGLALCLLSVFFYYRVVVVDPKLVQQQLEHDSAKDPYPTEPRELVPSCHQEEEEEEEEDEEEESLRVAPQQQNAVPPPYEAEWVDRMGPCERYFCGWFLAALAGIAYGTHTVPVLYMAENWDSLSKGSVVSYSPHGLDYVFSMTSGILLGSSVHVFIAVMGGWNISPRGGIPADALFPSLFSGSIWGLGHALVLFSATSISLAAVHPTIIALTPAVASLWQATIYRLSKPSSVKFLLAAILCSVTASIITLASIHQ